MPKATQHVAIIISVSIFVYFINLGGPRLWDRDEPRNAGCAIEMLEANDWVVPRFNGEVRDHKPVLLYWLLMSSYTLFGISEFSARFPSAALSVCTVLLTYSLGRRLINRDAAFWGALILSTTLMFTVAARAATPDALLIFCVTLTLWTYVYHTFSTPAKLSDSKLNENEQQRAFQFYPDCWWKIASIYAVSGLAVLAKGPVGLVLPTTIIGMFLLIMRLPAKEQGDSWIAKVQSLLRPFAPLHFLKTCWHMKPGTALLAASLVALPWYVWVAMRDYRWIEGFFLTHNLERATTSMEGHSGPPIYYPLVLCVAFFPWSVFFVPTVLEVVHAIRSKSEQYAGQIFLCCWASVWIAIFTIASTKLPSYVTPMYPALALLTGVYIDRLLKQTSAVSIRWYYAAATVFTVVGIGFIVALPIVASQVLPGEELLGTIGVILLIGGITAIVCQMKQLRTLSVQAMTVSSILFVVCMLAIATQRIDSHQQNHLLLSAIEQQAPDSKLYSYRVLEPSWIFYSRKTVKEFPGDEKDLIRLTDEKQSAVVITTLAHWDEFSEETKSQFTILAQEPYFMESDDLLVLLAKSSEVLTATRERPDATKSSR
ncbi:MAG: ArnT family glycosyltransferase [Pirellulales bacterium]